MKKIVGQVTEAERDEIQRLFERRNGLNELARILTATVLDELILQCFHCNKYHAVI